MQPMASYQRRIILGLTLLMLVVLMLKLIDRQRQAVSFDIQGFLDGYKHTAVIDTSAVEVKTSTNALSLPTEEIIDDKLGLAQVKVKINEADFVEIQRLPGVGPVLARRIIAFRDSAGTIRKTDDLLKVKGIGEKKLAQMKDYIEL